MTRSDSTPNADSVRPADPLPAGFGEGWMTKSARDLTRVAILIAGFDGPTLLRRLATYVGGQGVMNATTVENILGKMAQNDSSEPQ